ncbi:MAG TPA: 16S rRNA processing protein RimM [Desulfotomaculum sp.]|nr:16S rRNA processing protein RimM [Desulfotomaculum sp.]
MQDTPLITVGKILDAHGVRGWVRVLPLTDFPERFLDMAQVILLQNGQYMEYRLAEAMQHKQFVLLRFEGISDMNVAKVLKGALLQVTKEQLIKLPGDSYYIFDLLGLSVYTTVSEYLGELEDVLRTGANDVFVVKDERGRSVLIPALKQVVKKIDLDARRMVVELPEGLR